MFCMECGAEVTTDAKFCGKCGTKVADTVTAGSAAKERPLSKSSQNAQPHPGASYVPPSMDAVNSMRPSGASQSHIGKTPTGSISNSPFQSRSPATKTSSSSSTIGIVLMVIGVIWGIAAFNMDTTVTTLGPAFGPPGSLSGIPMVMTVHNIGKMDERRNHLIIAGLFVLVGAILFATGRR